MKIVKVLIISGATAALALSLAACAAPAKNAAPNTAVNTATNTQPAATADEITVTLNLKSDVTKPETQDTALQFSEESLNVNAPKGSTALSVLMSSGREVQTNGNGDTTEVIAIGGLQNGAAGQGSKWIYEVNGTPQTVSPAACKLEANDTLTFRFVK